MKKVSFKHLLQNTSNKLYTDLNVFSCASQNSQMSRSRLNNNVSNDSDKLNSINTANRSIEYWKSSSVLFVWVLAMSLAFVVTSCRKEAQMQSMPEVNIESPLTLVDQAKKGELDSAVQTWLGCMPMQMPIEEPMQMGQTTTEINGYYSCNVTPYQVAPGYDEVMVFSPSDILDVGRWLKGGSVTDGSFQPVPMPAGSFAPQTISISMPTQGGSSASTLIEEPSHSAYVNAHNELTSNLAQNATPAYVSYEIETVYEYNQALSHIGASLGGWGADIAGSYDFANTNTKSRFLVKLIQKYYTVDLDFPTLASEWFSDEIPDFEELSYHCPTFISSITYGRQIYVVIESSSSKEETKAALDASFQGWGADFHFEWGELNNNQVEITNVNAFVVGGSSNFLGLEGMSDLSAIIESGAQYSTNSPGVPIAFIVRRLSDTGIVNFVTLSEYNVQECTLQGDPHTINLNENQYHTLCPMLVHGDDEFDGNGPQVTGNVTLVRKNANTELWAVVDALFDEGMVDSDNDDTRATIDPSNAENHIWLYTAPDGKEILDIAEISTAYFSYLDGDSTPDEIAVNSGFIETLIINGDTEDGDIECDNDEDSFFRIQFKDINIVLSP